MSFRELVAVLWRRRLLLATLVVVSVIAVYLAGRPSGAVGDTYGGRVALSILDSDDGGESVDFYSFVTNQTDDIAIPVAEDLGEGVYGRTPTIDVLRLTVAASTIPELGTITIDVASQPDEDTAALVLEKYSEYLIEYSRDRRVSEHEEDLARLAAREVAVRERIAALSASLDALRARQSLEDQQAGRSLDPVLEAELSSSLSSLQTILAENDRLSGLTESDLTPLSVTSPPSVVVEERPPSPLSFRARLLLAVVLAGLLGVVLAFALDRVDTRLHDRKTTEAAYGLPVFATVPPLSWRRRRGHQILADTHPGAAVSEAYRLLRSNLARARRLQLAATGSQLEQASGGTVVLVGSASERSGKTTAVANLAAAAVDAGRSVLVVNADLRQPAVQLYFGVKERVGLTDAVDAIEESPSAGIDLGRYTQTTSVEQVDLLPSGHPVSNPGERLSLARPLFEQARARYELILVDTPAMLAGNDVSELMPFVDLVLVVAKAGSTTIEEGQWTAEIVERLQAPACGVALIGAHSDLERTKLSQRLKRRVLKALGRTDPFAVVEADAAESDAEVAQVSEWMHSATADHPVGQSQPETAEKGPQPDNGAVAQHQSNGSALGAHSGDGNRTPEESSPSGNGSTKRAEADDSGINWFDATTEIRLPIGKQSKSSPRSENIGLAPLDGLIDEDEA